MWLQLSENYLLFGIPFFVICFFGLLGVLPDLDRPLSVYLFPGRSRRFLHKPVFLASCFILLSLGTYFGGLLIRMVLR